MWRYTLCRKALHNKQCNIYRMSFYAINYLKLKKSLTNATDFFLWNLKVVYNHHEVEANKGNWLVITVLINQLKINWHHQRSLPIARDTDRVPFTRQVPMNTTQPPRSSILFFSLWTCNKTLVRTVNCFIICMTIHILHFAHCTAHIKHIHIKSQKDGKFMDLLNISG